MKQNKFTPGPWSFSKTNDYWIDDSAGRGLARYAVDESTEEIDLANARLMVSAPELLVALEHAVKSCGGQDEFYWKTIELIKRTRGEK